MRTKVFIPRDSAALAVGANRVARVLADEAAQRGIEIEIVRTGSRGLLWLEPLVEVETPKGRIGYSEVSPEQVKSLFDARFLEGATHPSCVGLVEEIPYLKNQERLTFVRCGITDPVSVEDYQKHGGYQGIAKALAMAPETIVQEVTDSGLRGRGGAAFPTGIKWKTVLGASADQKYIVCNADEGDSGTFADRMIMESDPHILIEGMLIAGIAVGASKGFIYVRSEYPEAYAILAEAIDAAQKAGYLGANIQGSGKSFNLEVRMAAGSYVCGEETALLESLEGRRGVVRAKPPLPALEGLFGKPTVINNVLSFAAVPTILSQGADFYKNYGTGRSRGTLPFQLAGNLKHGGLVEKAFGITLRQLLQDFGGGTASGKPMKAVQVGGPLGAYLPESQWDTPMDYEAFAAIGAVLGHGGIVAFDESVDMSQMARYAMEFCAIESCGKCTPCRIGSTRGVEVVDRLKDGDDAEAQEQLLRDLCDTMLNGSLCAMGGMTPFPVLSALNHYPADFKPRAGKSTKTTSEKRGENYEPA